MIWTKYRVYIIMSLIIVSVLLLNKHYYNMYRNAEKEIERKEANIKALNDTIRLTKAKDTSNEYNKLSYLVEDVKELKELNKFLAKEVEITKGKVLSIQHTGFQIVHDTIDLTTYTKVDGNHVQIYSELDTTYSVGNYRSLSIASFYDIQKEEALSKIVKDEIGFTATTGIVKRKDDYEIFVRPNYPNMKVIKLEGAIIEKNMIKRETRIPLVTIGGNIGWVPITYDLNAKKGDLNLSRIGVSFGLNFNLAAMLRNKK